MLAFLFDIGGGYLVAKYIRRLWLMLPAAVHNKRMKFAPCGRPTRKGEAPLLAACARRSAEVLEIPMYRGVDMEAKIAIVALLIFLGPLAGCTRSGERYQLIANSPQVQTWFDSRTGVSISCPLMSSDQGCQLYESFEKRTETIRKSEAADHEARGKADALAARDLQIGDAAETCNLADRECARRLFERNKIAPAATDESK